MIGNLQLKKIFSLLLLLTIYTYCHLQLFSAFATSTRAQSKQQAKWTVSPFIIEALAVEFKGIVADFLIIETGARLGNKKIANKDKDWDALVRLFNLAQHLDPHFQQTYVLAQGWLPWTANRVEETMEILKLAEEHRPWDWRPAYLRGFNTYYFFGDFAKAGKTFISAGTRPEAPAFLAILGARLALKGGETNAAIYLLKTMLAQREETDPDYDAINSRLKALEGVRVLEEAVKEYESLYGMKPDDLTLLLSKNILTELPHNPYNDNYCITHEGKIYFDLVNCLESKSKRKMSAQ